MEHTAKVCLFTEKIVKKDSIQTRLHETDVEGVCKGNQHLW